MRFGPVPLTEAVGAVLAHSAQVAGGRLRKGRVLDAADVAALASAGVASVEVARLDADDIPEDEAAAWAARAVCRGAGLEIAAAATGRTNVFAAHAGLFVVERAFVDAANAIHPALTVATLASDTLVAVGRMVATVKIIAFAVPRWALEALDGLADEADAPLAVAVQRSLRFGLVATRLTVVKEATMDKTARVLLQRLDALGCNLLREERVAHETAALASAIAGFVGEVDAVVVFGASAVVDAGDVIPAAIEMQPTGSVVQVGMPVDPGNLLVFGSVGAMPVIGAPGCARSPAENGFDWVLRRVCHGVPVTPKWVASLGVGGLLMEIAERPAPRKGTS